MGRWPRRAGFKCLGGGGWRPAEVNFPSLDEMQRVCLEIMFSEAAAFHSMWMADRPDDYGPEILARLRAGLGVTGPDYVRALSDQRRMSAHVARSMRRFDAILLPSTATVAPLIAPDVDTQPLVRFTRPFNLTGQPVFSLPAPVDGLPVGIQVIGHRGRDVELVAVAAGLEMAWANR